ncbi:MAG: hypothetical protein QGH45_13585 [Myxococcota bacterium]|nr:hypothetical protein [Myxococcota bacterium]
MRSSRIDSARFLVRVEGDHGRLGHLYSESSWGEVLTVTGSDCVVRDAVIRDARNPQGVIVDITGTAERCRLGVRVSSVQADAGVRVAGEETLLLPGSRIQDVRSGTGLAWSGEGGGWDGLEVLEIDRDGILIEGGPPRRMTRFAISRCNRVNGNYGAFHARSTAQDLLGALCTDFLIREDGTNHAYCWKMGTIGIAPCFGNWNVRGNVVDGGPLDIPPTGSNAFDLDTKGQGGSQPSPASGPLTLPVTASLYVVTGSNDFDSITPSWKGRRITLVFTGALTVSNGAGNLVLNGDLATDAAKKETLTLVCDGTDWFEVGRSLN